MKNTKVAKRVVNKGRKPGKPNGPMMCSTMIW